MRSLLAWGLLLALAAGCALPSTPAPEEVLIRAATTQEALVRIGPFVAGQRGVPAERVLHEATLAPSGEWRVRLAPGRYSIDGRVEDAYASSFFDVKSGRDNHLTLQERSTPYQASPEETPHDVRSLSWEE